MIVSMYERINNLFIFSKFYWTPRVKTRLQKYADAANALCRVHAVRIINVFHFYALQVEIHQRFAFDVFSRIPNIRLAINNTAERGNAWINEEKYLWRKHKIEYKCKTFSILERSIATLPKERKHSMFKKINRLFM